MVGPSTRDEVRGVPRRPVKRIERFLGCALARKIIMPGEDSLSSSLSSASKWLTAGTLSFAALLGTTWMVNPGDDKSQKGASPVVVGAQQVPTDALREQHHLLRIRSPLYDFFGIEPHEEPTALPTLLQTLLPAPNRKYDAWDLDVDLKERLQAYDLDFLVLTVADPIDSVTNCFFDHQLDALQKALVAESNDSWLYSGGYLPWQAFKDQRSVTPTVPLLRKKHWYQDEPGLLVFRQEKKAVENAKDRLLLVYLVGEMPTLGIQQDAMLHAVREIAILTQLTKDPPEIGSNPGDQIPIPIIGPTFTGGAYSLKEGLKHGLKVVQAEAELHHDPCHSSFKYLAQIMNGSATAIPDDYFQPDFPLVAKSKTADSEPTNLQFLGSTICGYQHTANALSKVAGGHPIIWLTETGTEFSSNFRHKRGTNSGKKDLFIPVPVGISRVRSAFERHLAAAKQQSIGLNLIEATSPLPFDPEETAHDVPPIQTPLITASSVELLLNEIMRTILVSKTAYVGLMATDIRDTIFLAEMLKLRCPHLQLLIVESDVLLTHPSYTDSLRGAIVASSYPHFPEGIEACRRNKSLPIMGGPAQYGIYNAVLLQRALARENTGLAYVDDTGNFVITKVPQDAEQFTGENLAGLCLENGTISPRVWLHTVGYDRLLARSVSKPINQESKDHQLLQIDSVLECKQKHLEFK
ncbi:MAG: hypothetical protein JWM11_6285, partial [Planctomycetaceae bacterium]|nr:hypothetical protein [Planctomycetaceae bacterium]